MQTQQKICPNCAYQATTTARFCERCGQVLPQSPPPAQPNPSAYTSPYAYNPALTDPSAIYEREIKPLEPYIGPNREFYLQKFLDMLQNNRVISWNWSAFLFPYAWFAYRRLYSYAIASALIGLLLTFFFSFFAIFTFLPVMLLSGLAANQLYLRSLRTYSIQAPQLPNQLRKEHFKRSHGTDELAMLLIAGSFLMLSAIIIPLVLFL